MSGDDDQRVVILLRLFVSGDERPDEVVDLSGRTQADQVGADSAAGTADGVALQAVQFLAAIKLTGNCEPCELADVALESVTWRR